MGVKASTWAWAQKVTYAEKLVLLALADHADDEGVCWPSQEKLSDKTGITRTRVSRLVHSLKQRGLIQIEARKVKGLQKSNKYRLQLGLMLIPCVGGAHGHVSVEHTDTCSGSTLETSIETSKEPSLGASAGDPMKTFGEKDVQAVLNDAQAKNKMTPTEALAKAKKVGSRYPVAEVRKVWAVLGAHYEFGFLPEWTMKQKGQVNQLQEKLETLGVDFLEVIAKAFERWPDFVEYTGAKKPPHKPDIGFMLAYVGSLGMWIEDLQSVATGLGDAEYLWGDDD